MKNVSRLVVVCAAAALFSVTALAQDAAAPAAPAAGQDCEAAKTDPNLYPKWLSERGGDAAKQKVAYEAGKQFLAKCEGVEDAYVAAVKKWVARYDEAVGKFQVRQRFEEAAKALDAAPAGSKNYAPLFAAGKEYVAAEPENLNTLLVLTNVGVLNSTAGPSANKSLDPDALSFARRALALVEAGKGTPDQFKLLNAANKDEAVIALNYRLGILNRATAPEEAVTQLLRVAQSNSALKSEPSLYFYLAQAYTDGPYKKLIAEYQQKFPEGQAVPDERKAEYEQYQARLDQSVDRIIDAYARAAALNTKNDEFKKLVMTTLTNLYKQRQGTAFTEAGLNEYIAASATRRLPLPTDPLPTPAPAPTPTNPSTTTTTPPAATPTTGTTATTTPAAKPKP